MAATAAAAAAGDCVAGDLILMASLLATAFVGGVVWPAALLAAGASSVRLSLAGRAARRCLAARAALT